jgi:uncharacterized surface protein with fasciclin (FAS1) repeats
MDQVMMAMSPCDGRRLPDAAAAWIRPHTFSWTVDLWLEGNRKAFASTKPMLFEERNPMSKRVVTLLLAGLTVGAAVPAIAQTTMASNTVMVGGAPMYPSKNIIENAVNSKDHTTLVAAVKAAGLVETLEGKGPFTVFAPTNEAFAKLPPGTVDTLLKPENKPMLVKILTYHVVSGSYTAADLMKMVKAGGGKAMLKTVEGEPLTISENGTKLFVSGEKSGVSEVTISNVKQSNGVIHVINTVVLPG